MHARLLDSAARTATWLRDFNGEPMSLLRALRFDTVGHDPLTGEPLNVVERPNQTFTILVTLRASQRLTDLHPEARGFRLALATPSRDTETTAPHLLAAARVSGTAPASTPKTN